MDTETKPDSLSCFICRKKDRGTAYTFPYGKKIGKGETIGPAPWLGDRWEVVEHRYAVAGWDTIFICDKCIHKEKRHMLYVLSFFLLCSAAFCFLVNAVRILVLIVWVLIILTGNLDQIFNTNKYSDPGPFIIRRILAGKYGENCSVLDIKWTRRRHL